MPRKSEVGEKLNSLASSGRKALAWLLDPDDFNSKTQKETLYQALLDYKIDFIFLGGSLIQQNNIEELIFLIKNTGTHIPVVLFPGNAAQFSDKADALLFLTLISGRNPELLIGQHIQVAPQIHKSDVEILPTGYMLVDGGQRTSVHYISQTIPLPNHLPELSLATALAGHYLGLQYFYLDAGSGADIPVSSDIIKAIKKEIKSPLLVGGGLNTLEKVKVAYQAGADVVIIGNGARKDSNLIKEVSAYLEKERVLWN